MSTPLPKTTNHSDPSGRRSMRQPSSESGMRMNSKYSQQRPGRSGGRSGSSLLAALLSFSALLAAVVLSAQPATAATPGQGFLPDDRAWEMVSPPDKNGHDVSPFSWKVRVADEGDAVTFMSLGGFGDIYGNTAYGTEYLSQLGSGNWDTHGITPNNGLLPFPGSFGPQMGYHGSFSSDLSRGVFLALGALTDEDPDVADVHNLYLRDDLRQSGPGDYNLLSSCPGCTEPLPFENFEHSVQIAYADASDDYSHVVFETTDNLTGETTGTDPKAYEWLADTGEIRLVGVLPDDSCGSPPCFSDAAVIASGAGGGFQEIGFTATEVEAFDESMHAISADGSRIFFTDYIQQPEEQKRDPAYGDVYVREDGTLTTQINVSERTDCADADPCTGDPAPDPGGHQSAYWGAASEDGSLVYFVTTEQLTDDDADAGKDVYQADLDAPAGERLTLVSTTGNAYVGAAVLGVSDDGQIVYYLDDQHEDSVSFAALQVWDGSAPRHIADYSAPLTNGQEYHWGEGSRTTEPQAFVGENVLRVSADGRHVVFQSSLESTMAEVGYDNTVIPGRPDCDARFSTNCTEVFVYDLDSGQLDCASCNPSGARPRADAQITAIKLKGVARRPVNLNRVMSENGSRVFFSSPDPLVAGDTNGRYDAYVYDTETGKHHLLSSGQDDSDSWFLNASADGGSAFFTTRERLVGTDVDDNIDLYVARVGGGLALQNPPTPPPACEGDECQSESDPPPPSADPGSAGHEGAGNPQAKPDCSNGKQQAQKLQRKAKQLDKRAKKASGKKAKQLDKKAKKAKKKAKKAKRELRDCRSGK